MYPKRWVLLLLFSRTKPKSYKTVEPVSEIIQENKVESTDLQTFIRSLVFGNQDEIELIDQFLAAFPLFTDANTVWEAYSSLWDPVKEAPNNGCHFLVRWLELFFDRDFGNLSKRLKPLLEFISCSTISDFKNRCKLLMLRKHRSIPGKIQRTQSLHRKLQISEDERTRSLNRLSSSHSMDEMDPKKNFGPLLQMGLAHLDPNEIAEQLTLREFKMFSNIRDSEWFEKEGTIPSINNSQKLAGHFNEVHAWLSSEIVSHHTQEHRVMALTKCIKIGCKFRDLNNFNGVMEVLSVLGNASITRLKKTWELIEPKVFDSYKDLEILMSDKYNYKNYREALKCAKLPAIPFVGVIKRDIIFAQEMTSYIDAEQKQINLNKVRIVGKIILDVKKIQKVSYSITRNDKMNAYIANYRVLDPEEIYNVSIQCEPKKIN